METKGIATVENVNEVINSKNEVVMTKEQVIENARIALAEKKQFLADNANAEKNIVKSAETNVTKAERSYVEALQARELPTTTVELWNVQTSTEEQEIISKKKAEIIIATSDYSMTVSKVNVELGKDLIKDSRLEKMPLFVTDAKLFYDAEITLKDLNGNIVPKNTPNVFVSVDTANGYWKWKTYHEANINSIVKNESALIIENVRIKTFSSLQEFAQYRGVNNVLSRGFNGLEKAGNAALATQNEFYKKIFEVAKELKANISVVTKYYNLGKTLNLKVWNDAMLGIVSGDFSYDLTIGDELIETLQKVTSKVSTIKERYMIDAITRLANLQPQGAEDKIGIKETIKTIETLNKETVAYVEQVSLDKVNEIYTALLTQYLKNHEVIKEEQTA
ncbi:hypothetical protein [Bacteroides oleiciplenus]|uniref:Uncharacterized protein n=1 Tax=Bacteroides oleiciplenus YIT 12058 TaxID=742727 RepID=K9EDF2_9BACE|nr:hypothetical protein [Bacteroides oleiciplenus]EKU88932.1 hypothetical protein HMPREF9447_03806 [Bacteroides oleiciplenus YIT 12058]